MSHYRTYEEVGDEYARLLGPELGQLYHELQNDVNWLHMKWGQYRELFADDSARIDLLNRTAPLFFGVVQNTLFEDVLLHLARLTDPPKSRSRENLTILKLPELILDSTLKCHLESDIEQVKSVCRFARRWRNRHLAHSDLQTNRNPELLPPTSRKSVEEALAAIRELLNRLEQYYCSSEVWYESIVDPGGAECLLYYLEKGLKLEEI